MRNWLAVLMVVGMVAGCAHKRASNDFEGNVDSTVHIENHHWGDVDVYLIHDGQRTRLGTVTATTNETFTVSSRLVGAGSSMQLEAHAIGMQGVLDSESIGYRRGMQINWTIESNLSRATLSIF